MQKVVFDQVGEPAEVLRCGDAAVPTPGPGEVLVRMLASPVNPSDLMFIRGLYTTAAHCPASPGFEGVGIVEQSGGGLRGKLFQGKRVAVLNRAGGNWAEKTVVPADQVIPLSKTLSTEAAATFFVNPATAWIMTQEVLKVRPGEFLLQTAAGSSLGRMLIRLANHIGFQLINVVRRDAQADELRQLGAKHVIVFDDKHQSADWLIEQIHRVTGPDGLKYAIDPVGATGAAVLSALTTNGHALLFGTLSNQPISISPRTLMTHNLTVEGFWLGNFMASQSLFAKLRLIRRITGLITAGVLASEIDTVLPLTAIQDAVRAAESGIAGRKVLLAMNEFTASGG